MGLYSLYPLEERTGRGISPCPGWSEHNRLIPLLQTLRHDRLYAVEREKEGLVAGRGFEPLTFGL